LLRDRVENADDAEDLPEGLTHGNYHAWSAVGRPANLVITGWGGSGRGPRLPALAWLLTTAAEAGLSLVDAAIRGYSDHIQLTDGEIERLPQVLGMKPLSLACLDYRQAVRAGHTPTMEDGWPPWDRDPYPTRRTNRRTSGCSPAQLIPRPRANLVFADDPSS